MHRESVSTITLSFRIQFISINRSGVIFIQRQIRYQRVRARYWLIASKSNENRFVFFIFNREMRQILLG